MTSFDDWLRALAVAQKGGAAIGEGVIKSATRGLPWSDTVELPGDYSTATLAGAIRAAPDATGSALATFTVSTGDYDSGADTTSFTVSLTDTATAALPADTDGNGVVTLPASLMLTPLGEDTELLFGWAFVLLGRV